MNEIEKTKKGWNEIIFDALLKGAIQRVDRVKIKSSDCCIRCSGSLPTIRHKEISFNTEVGSLCPDCFREVLENG
jgi:hypothetical protein